MDKLISTNFSIQKVTSDTVYWTLSEKKKSIQFEIPYEKLSIFVKQYESSKPLSNVPIFVVVQLGVKYTVINNIENTKIHSNFKVHVPLGTMGTDHVGYTSFDLQILKTSNTIDAIIKNEISESTILHILDNEVDKNNIYVFISNLWVLPFGDKMLTIDVMEEGYIAPQYIVYNLELDQKTLDGRIFNIPMTSMQNPNIIDWNLSPGSFTSSTTTLIGSDGCETLLPSNLSTQQFSFHQVARAYPDILNEKFKGILDVTDLEKENIYKFGYIFEYKTEWFPIGHSLGNLSYSLPLAPGEMVKLAIIDWSRKDSISRDESNELSESLIHSQLRDRDLTESVQAMLDEWQRGGSIMAGVAGSATMGTYGASAALGGAYTTSSGTRNLQSNTAQHIADSFRQASSALRELRSTIVVNNKQEEKSNVQTRIIANYNHGHAITILYYEVLRHYRVITKLTNVREALLINFKSKKHDWGDYDFLLAHRKEIENILLDDRLKSCFDNIVNVKLQDALYNQENSKVIPKEEDIIFKKYILTVKTGSEGDKGTDASIYLKFQLYNNTEILSHPVSGPFSKGTTKQCQMAPIGAQFTWKDLRSFKIHLNTEGTYADWRLDYIKLEGVKDNVTKYTIYDAYYNSDVQDGTDTSEFPVDPPPPSPLAPVKKIKIEDIQKISELKNHLTEHSYYYDRILWLNGDVNKRSAILEEEEELLFSKFFPDISELPILDIIENKAIELSGDWIAFPIMNDKIKSKFPDDINPYNTNEYIEELLSLPIRGVFAESKLGNCNSNEIIDNTRFWDWQKSPIPNVAPDITGVDAGSRYQPPTGITPTGFPQSLINIVNPQNLPDPTGLISALKVLETPNIFRDQSAVKEVESLLSNLSNNATIMATKNNNRKQLLNDIRESPELSDEQKSALVHDVFTKDINSASSPPKTSPDSIPEPPGHEHSIPPKTSPDSIPEPPGHEHSIPPKITPDAIPEPPGHEHSIPPKSNKPKLPDLQPPKGYLLLDMNFRSVDVVTPINGVAHIALYHDSSDPNITIEPEIYNNNKINAGFIRILSKNYSSTGHILITAIYKLKHFKVIKNIGPFELPDISPDDYANYTLKSDSYRYELKNRQKTLVLFLTPETEPKTISYTEGEDIEKELNLSGGIGIDKVVDFKVTGRVKDTNRNVSTITAEVKFVTGKLIISENS